MCGWVVVCGWVGVCGWVCESVHTQTETRSNSWPSGALQLTPPCFWRPLLQIYRALLQIYRILFLRCNGLFCGYTGLCCGDIQGSFAEMERVLSRMSRLPTLTCLFCKRALRNQGSNSKETSQSRHTSTHCNTLQHTATHCNTLQHTATHCNTLQRTYWQKSSKNTQLIHQRDLTMEGVYIR